MAEEYRIDYDKNGNIIYDQESNVYREYNELNQLIRTRINNASGTILQEYTYDPLKERIFIKDEFYSNGSLKSSTYYFDDDYVVIQNSSGIYNETYIFQDGILVGYEDTDGKKRYVLPDHEGSAHVVLDESGNVLEENLFSPFAEPLEGVKENKFSYEAKEYDPLVQDYDFQFRKYLPNIHIFGQPDDEINDPYNPQYLNRYSFELNNPYRYTDPDGHYIETAFDIAFIASDITAINEDPSDITNYLALGADIVGALLPGATGLGLGVRALDKGADALKAGKAMEVTKAQRLAENAARGKEFQAKELAARGLKENTANFKVQDKATGKIVGTRPDAVTKTKIVEMKDKKYITSTQQLRAQAQLGQQQNKQNVLITTAKKISESVRKLFKIEPSKSKSSKSSKKGKK